MTPQAKAHLSFRISSSDHDAIVWLRYGWRERFLPFIILTSTSISGVHGSNNNNNNNNNNNEVLNEQTQTLFQFVLAFDREGRGEEGTNYNII